MKNLLLALGLVLFSSFSFAEVEQPRIQIAILLDTSSSMDGLIDQAKAKLWKIVNHLATTKKKGQIPQLEVALFEFGKSTLKPRDGFIKMLVPLTEDLDAISEALFQLKTQGGDEYCGEVISKATKNLAWSQRSQDYRAIFIAGNESFLQGEVPARESCIKAIGKGIIVNTIFCGPESQGIQLNWKDGADLADGRFMVINQDQTLVSIKAPQDTALLELGQKLNKTYIAYGKDGGAMKKRQEAQDKNASAMSAEVAVQRVMAKKAKAYKTTKWDMVAAMEEDETMLDSVEEESLPEEMQKMTKEEKKAYVAEKTKERNDIKAQIDKLQKERAKWVAGKTQDGTLDKAMLQALTQQLKKQAFEVEEN